MRNYKKLDIWKNGIEIVKQVYALSNSLPTDERFGLKSQITRASVSIASNIAEGCSRNSEAEFKRFLEIAIGSLFEVETQLLICVELDFFNKTDITELSNLLDKEARMINGLINKIKNS